LTARTRTSAVLGGSTVVVASLVTLVALFGPILVMAEGWLDARLPHAREDDRRVIGGYTVVTLVGLFLGLMAVVPPYLGPEDLRPSGVALLVVGVATLACWRSRVIGRPLPGWDLAGCSIGDRLRGHHRVRGSSG
jgi:hypothetical protein